MKNILLKKMKTAAIVLIYIVCITGCGMKNEKKQLESNVEKENSLENKYKNKVTDSLNMDYTKKVSYKADDGTWIKGYNSQMSISCNEKIDTNDLYGLLAELLEDSMKVSKNDVASVDVEINNNGKREQKKVKFMSKERNKIMIYEEKSDKKIYKELNLEGAEYLAACLESNEIRYEVSGGKQMDGTGIRYEVTLLKKVSDKDLTDDIMECVSENEEATQNVEGSNIIEYEFDITLYGKNMGRKVVRYKDFGKSQWVVQ